MPIYTVTLHGVPLGLADLPHDRTWAGGRVAPLPAFDTITPLLVTAAQTPALAAALLELPRGAPLPTAGLPPLVAAAYDALAALPLDLLDEAGLPAGAELVRLAPFGAAPDAVVRVYFRHAPSGVAALQATAPRGSGGALPSPGA